LGDKILDVRARIGVRLAATACGATSAPASARIASRCEKYFDTSSPSIFGHIFGGR